MSRRGFSMIEMLIVVAITAVIATASFFLISNRQGSADLQAAASEIVTALRAAQLNAVNAASSTAWGVRFDNTTSTAPRFVVFASSTYAASAVTTEYRMSNRVGFDTTSVPPGTTKDVIFAIRTGTTAATSVTIRVTGTTKTYVMDINSGGLVTATRTDQSQSTSTAPTVSGISPNSGTNTGSLSITSISGTNFVSGATVKLTRAGQSDITGSGFSVSNATTIAGGSFNLSGAQTGTWNVVVTNPNTESGTCTGCFTVNAPASPPTATDVSPNTGQQGATNLSVTITGTNFVSGASVAFSGTGITVNNTTFNSQTQLTSSITISGGASTGARNVTVTNPDTLNGSCTNCFTVTNAAPTVSSVSPSSRGQGAAGAGLTITGTNFVSGATPSFSGTGITITTSSYVSATQLSATVDVSGSATTGARNVTVTNPDTQNGTGTGVFTVNAKPTATNASPNTGTQGDSGLSVVVTGTNFVSGATASFSGTGVTVNSTTFNSSTQLTLSVTIAGNAATGTRDIVVTNGDGGVGTGSSLFTVNLLVSSPTVASTTPSTLAQGATSQNVVITGTNFASGAAASFSGTGITVNNTTYNSTTQVTANVTVSGAATLGSRDVTVTNTDTGSGTGVGVFAVTAGISAPTVTNASPNNLQQGATSQSVVITGTGFVSGATASFSGTGVTVNSTTFDSATQVTANVTVSGSATTGARDVTVTNPDTGSDTATGAFTVNAKPTVTDATPDLHQGASGQTVTITGTGFASGATASFSGTGITVNSTTFVNSTQVTANVTVSGGAATGARNVTVTNGTGAAGTGTSIFTVLGAPTVSTANPSSLHQGDTGQSVIITGTNFASGAAATFSGTGITVNSTTYNSTTQVTANVTIAGGATLGARDVTVTNSDGTAGTGTGDLTITAAQQNTGYLLGSSATTGGTGTWTAPTTGTWFTDDNPASVSTALGLAAFTSSQSPTVLFKGFSFGIPVGATIDKICVLIDDTSTPSSQSGAQEWQPSLTWNGGTNYTTANPNMADITNTSLGGVDQYFQDTSTAPGTSDPGTSCTTWGRTWTQSEMSSANFGVKVTGANSQGQSRSIRFDVVKVKVYYTP